MASIQLSIADPCHENWNNMLPEEKGRFCLSCQKTVIDFTNMSDGQVFNYFKNYTGNTCGQFTPAQLNREITKPKMHTIGHWKYFWQILLPAVFAFNKSEAQMLKGEVASKVACKANSKKPVSIRMGMVAPQTTYRGPAYKLHGTIVNEKGEPVPNASIASQSGKYTVADSTGHFLVQLLPGENLTISSVGYKARSFSYDSLQQAAIKSIEVGKGANTITIEVNIELKENVINPLDVVVVGYESIRRGSVTGTSSIIYKTGLFKHVISPTNNLPQLKIFPNPIQPGQDFQISLQLKKQGNYQLRITDAAGKMLLEKKLNITSENQTETVEGETLQHAGIYFVNILNPGNKNDKGLTSKIVVH